MSSTTPYLTEPAPAPVEARPAPARPPLPAQVRRVAELSLRVASALSTVEDAQWQMPPGPRPTGRQAIGHEDVTGETTANPERLRLRSAAVAAELELERAAIGLEAALRHLDDATERWSGLRHRR